MKKSPVSPHRAMLAALDVTRDNIRSLGPAGALDSVPMPYRNWLSVVEAAITTGKQSSARKESK